MDYYLRDLRILVGVGSVALCAVLFNIVTGLFQSPDVAGFIGAVTVGTLVGLSAWFALRGQIPAARANLRTVLLSGGVVGGIAFAAGFLGPLLANPSSGQGPLLGFLIAPIGFVVGALIGLGRILFAKQADRAEPKR